MAYTPGAMPPPQPPGLLRPPGSSLSPHSTRDRPSTPAEPTTEPVPPPPKDMWPCGCAYPGQHKADCMWSLWEQMKDNYDQTKKLMSQFMGQVVSIQTDGQDPKCKCPPGCHAKDLGEAMGLEQMRGVTVPWLQPFESMGTGANQALPINALADGYMSESRKLMEEQRIIKNTWTQFLNIFDMALDLANDVSKDRWEAARRRKERERLERQQRKEEEKRLRQERREKCAEERQQQAKPSETPDKGKGKKDAQEKKGSKSVDSENQRGEEKDVLSKKSVVSKGEPVQAPEQNTENEDKREEAPADIEKEPADNEPIPEDNQQKE